MVIDEKDVFVAALALPDAEQREAYLQAACAGHPELLGRLRELLSAHEESLGPLDRRPAALGVTVDAAPTEGPGTVIGPYKLLQQIGEGDMGTVFMAEQTQPVQRKVALKLIKAGMDSRQVIARFEAERQALAMMDQVNIARVFDGGTTESGRPYFVMELVHGVPITKYCDDNHLTPRERLELFVPVCQAIQHAHQKGIIHRDVKPSNVMVTLYDGKPVPKVIDFGVAKATEQKLTERTLFTQYGTMVGTLEYMSPEQAEMSALGVDTRSDIYSLGVLLYELLTGSTPLTHKRMKEAAYAEILRLIKEEEPPRPSTRLSDSGEALASISANRHTEPAKLTKLVRGELDWIVMKTLEKDRNRRYETANGFAADVQRYLADEPVQACPPSAWYRFRKFARRNKAALVMTSVIGVALLLAVSSAFVVQAASNERIKGEQKQTKDALDREKQTTDALIRSLENEERTKYFRSIALAERELAAGNVGRAEEILEECPVQFRGWEWHYLKHRRQQEPVLLRGSGWWMSSVAYSLDGKYLAFAGVGRLLVMGEIKVWDRTTGRNHLTLSAHLGPVAGVAFSSDGRWLATAGWDKTVKVWEVATGKLVHTLSDHTAYVSGVVFSSDGKFLAAGGGDRTIRIWDATTFQYLRALSGHGGGVYGIAFGSGGTLASSSSDATVRVWDAATGREVHVLRGHTGLILGVAFSRDGKRLASAGFDGTVNVWDAGPGRHIQTIRDGVMPICSVAFSRDGRRLAAGGMEKTVRLWDVEDDHEPQEVVALRGHTDAVMGMAVSPDGLQIASAALDGTVKLWDSTPVSAGPELLTIRGHTGPVFSVAYRPTSGEPNRAILASASQDTLVKFWDAATGENTLTLRGHTGPVARLVFSRDGRRLASADYAGTTIVWDIEAGKELRTLRIVNGFGGNVALDLAGGRAAFALEGATIHVRDVDTGKEVIPPFRTHLGPVTFVAFSPDGRRLATASWDRTARLWDAATGTEVHSFVGHAHLIQSAAFSDDGRRFATASWDKTAMVWDTGTGKELLTLRGHEDRVTGVAFSPDGKHLATSSQDNTVRVWDAATGKEVAVLRGHTGYVLSVAFSPDGKRLASSSGYRGKGEVKVWDTSQWDRKPIK